MPQYHSIYETVETQYPGATPRERFNEGLRQLMDALVSGLIEGVRAAAEAANVRDVEDVRHFETRLAAFTPEAADASRQLKQFLYANVYTSPDLSADRARSMQRIRDLFRFFLDYPDSLPENYRERAEAEPLHRVICDYIAGMTDNFFEKVYAMHVLPAA